MKNIFISILLILSLLLTGCSQANERNGANSLPSTNNQSAQASNPSEMVSSAAFADVSQINLNKIQGKIKNLYYASGGQMLISADKLYLYDLTAGKAIAEAPKEALENPRYWTLANGYVAFGRIQHEDNEGSNKAAEFAATGSDLKYRVVFYDKNLKKISEPDFAKLLYNGEDLISTKSISFSSDGNRIAYAMRSGLYIYDLKQGKRTKVLDLKGKDAKMLSGLTTLEQIGFTNGDKSIAFKAQSFDVPPVNDKPSFDTYGIVNIDGSGFFNRKCDGYATKELTAYDTKLLMAENFRTATGKLMVIDSPDGKTRIYNLAAKTEGGCIYGSDSGRYFASSVAGKTGFIIRVYDTETGKLQVEHPVSNDGQALYGIDDPVIRVLDDARTCVVLLGEYQNAVKTKITTFAF